MKLMVCLDGSDFSKAVVPTARMIAEAAGAEVHVVRAVNLNELQNIPYGEGRTVERDRVIDQQREELRQDLHVATRELPPERICAVVFGEDPVDALIEYVREHDIDLIAMASHSRPPVGEFISGSTARGVLRRGVAPVVLVHPSSRG